MKLTKRKMLAFIKDESMASKEYYAVYKYLRSVGAPTLANIFLEMSKDEGRHHDNLVKIFKDMQ